jgi:hypothetical protein
MTNSHLEVTVGDYTELNKLIDHLRHRQIELRSLLPHRRTLEESFFAAIQGAASGDFNEMKGYSEKP